MNEKFFDLKKEKQDRMINAALKIFAQNGYAHASTDDIVKEAGISKGLLFHYFTNKIGLYSFIYDYSTKYTILEMTSTVDISDNDYFGLHLQIENAKVSVMKSYPYMIAFLNSTKNENVLEALNEIADRRNVVKEKIDEYFAHANRTHLKENTDVAKLDEIIEFVCDAVLLRILKEDEYRVDAYYTEVKKYLVELRNIGYK
ncbi:MAG: TetR/AcrR family transcriptional regulator [Lachnospiraceae bacterium]|nr:TetR/AcrR family transcriptional regulator [Lachnospiraceae bacterium]